MRHITTFFNQYKFHVLYLDLLYASLYNESQITKKKGIKKPAMDDADRSDADRSNTNCKLNIRLYIGITYVLLLDSRLCLFAFYYSPSKGGQNIN